MFVAPDGTCVIMGWVDDRAAPLQAIVVSRGREPLGVTRRAARCRRPDAELAVGLAAGTLLGFWTIVATPAGSLGESECAVTLAAGDKRRTEVIRPKPMADLQFRDTVFEYLAGAKYFGNPAVEASIQLDHGPGRALLQLNARMSSRIVALAYAERFGPERAGYKGSVIVCLYGRAEFLFLQNAFFSALPGVRDYEFIYVCNSPDLTETLQREAHAAERVYGLSQTVVFLPGNAGFGAANNAAVGFARSDRIMITNPDVFPRDPDWFTRHEAVIRGAPTAQTALFGAPLY